MPELPEVEHVARQLRADLVGRRIVRASVFWPRSVSGMTPDAFEQALGGRLVKEVGRRGKYLLVTLDNGQVLVVHRRMSGNLIFADAQDGALYVRVAFALDDGRYLLYSDPRKFGRLMLVPSENLADIFTHLGPEPLDEAFTPAVLAKRLAGGKRSIKATLLDQSVIAGVGNIYADEALYAAQIHPLRPADSLDADEINRLHAAIQSVLEKGIEHGGTTFGRYRDAYNEAGGNFDHLVVYQKTGQPCPRCGTPIERITVAQRGTHYCPHCQRLPEETSSPSPYPARRGAAGETFR
jgi:formamidopyrimidine-DNA glycosylase